MKKLRTIVAVGLAVVMMAGTMAGCAKKKAVEETAAPETTVAETAAASEAAKETAAPQASTEPAVTPDDVVEPIESKDETYESKDGWQISYGPELFSFSEGNNGEIILEYKGKSSGKDKITISYHKDKSPNEVLYEKTADDDQEKVRRSEGWFGGTFPNWTYTREADRTIDGAEVNAHYTGIEHNGGTLLIDVCYYKETDDDINMDKSDNFSGVLDSLKFTKHEPQQELAYRIGTYERKYKEEMEGQEQTFTDTITLNADHTGTMSFQDDIPIIWSSIELIETEGNNRYEYTVEGDNLMLNMNDGGEWLTFERKK